LIGASGIWVKLGTFLADGEKRSLAGKLNSVAVPYLVRAVADVNFGAVRQ